MKKLLLTALLTLMIGISSNAQAATITTTPTTLPEYSSPEASTVSFFNYTVGTFNYVIPVGQKIVSAVISGNWGNSLNPTTANTLLSISGLNGVVVADTRINNPDPYFTYNMPSWSYTFNASDYSFLNGGSVTLLAQMLTPPVMYYTEDNVNFYPYYPQIRMGATSLSIDTAPVPEPSSMILGLMGLGSMLGLRRKKA